MEPAETFVQVVERLRAEYAPTGRGVIERIILEEHDLLVGVQPGDILPPVVVEATVERVARLRERHGAGERAEPA